MGLADVYGVFSGLGQNEPSDGGKLKIVDSRKTDPITKKNVQDSGRLNADASTEIINHIINAANKYGVDPYTALAIAHQETGLAAGGDTEWNPFHLLDNRADDLISDGMRQLKDKFEYARKLGKKDEADVIQAFNGYGKIGVGTEGYGKKFYGLDVTQPLDMNKNPVYGKRIIDIRDNILKMNPEIVKLVEGSKNPFANAVKPTGQISNERIMQARQRFGDLMGRF